jgi:cytochrome c biogenesis protein CcdA
VLTLVVLVGSLGLADSLNPSTIAPALVLAGGRHASARLVAFMAGVFAVSVAGGLLLAFGPGQLLLDAIPRPSAHAKHVIEVAGGAILIVIAIVVWLGRARISWSLARRAEGRRATRGGASALALGAGIMAVELPTALPYFAAIAAIVGSDAALSVRAGLIVLYNLAFVAPLIAILVLRSLAGDRAAASLESFRAWIYRRSAMLLAILLAALGIVCLAIGIAGPS